MTPAGPDCRRRSAASSPSIPWPTISRRCSIRTGSPARSRLRVSPSAVRSRCISLPDIPSAPAPSWSAARPPASPRSAAPRRWSASREIEAAGMAFAVEDSMQNGYAPELRGDIKRFERFRARWLGNDPASYATIWRMLAAADMQDELTPAELSGPRDRRQPRSRAPAAAGGSRGQSHSRRPLRRNPHRALHVGANTRSDLRLHRRVPEIGRRLIEPDHPLTA